MANYQKSEITKNRIIDITKKLLEEKGFDNVTVRDICREANVSVSMLNYHFGSKDNLYHILLGILSDKIMESLDLYYPELKEKSKTVHDLSYILILIESLLVDNDFMKTYRKMHCQPYTIEQIKAGIRKNLVIYHKHSGSNPSEQLLEIYSNAFAAAITSVAKEDSYALLSQDIERVKMIMQTLFLHIYFVREDMLEVTRDALAISDKLKVKMSSFDNIEVTYLDN